MKLRPSAVVVALAALASVVAVAYAPNGPWLLLVVALLVLTGFAFYARTLRARELRPRRRRRKRRRKAAPQPE